MILVLNQSTLSLIFSIVRFPGCAKFVPSGDPLAELLMEQPKSNTLWLGRKDRNRIYKERYLFIVYSWTITRKFPSTSPRFQTSDFEEGLELTALWLMCIGLWQFRQATEFLYTPQSQNGRRNLSKTATTYYWVLSEKSC